ncbi:MAG: prepilin-type N-terminal cleavage/methylation domain-containing protein [Gemmatimonadota bacterium]|nr:prepilin-type N-terminal cleavage/methylation domain-containing protein [Gemmatimonadota bacterium]MDH4348175.1 prepilin-type N-terminal cleavage/methylation domain-containing protein [Gemmatimonadota bacterium]
MRCRDGPSGHRTVGPSVRRTVSPSGFTLIEVLVAILVTGLVALIGHQLVAGALLATREAAVTRTALDRERNAHRWLAAAFRTLEVGGEAGPFEGAPDRVRFDAWLPRAEGWSERATITLGMGREAFIASASNADPLVLRDSVTAVAFDYLLEPGATTRWVRTWVSPVSAPLAVRLRISRPSLGGETVDTLLLLIGPRG